MVGGGGGGGARGGGRGARSADVVYVLRSGMCEETHLVKAAYTSAYVSIRQHTSAYGAPTSFTYCEVRCMRRRISLKPHTLLAQGRELYAVNTSSLRAHALVA
jgi:hypothetical protein